MLTATFRDTATGIESTALIPAEHAPALRSSINEIRNELGERVSGAHKWPKEEALTRAVSAMGNLAAALNYVIPGDDPDYA
jgi:hypothetical protein